jgi:hypothetical protein
VPEGQAPLCRWVAARQTVTSPVGDVPGVLCPSSLSRRYRRPYDVWRKFPLSFILRPVPSGTADGHEQRTARSPRALASSAAAARSRANDSWGCRTENPNEPERSAQPNQPRARGGRRTYGSPKPNEPKRSRLSNNLRFATVRSRSLVRSLCRHSPLVVAEPAGFTRHQRRPTRQREDQPR